MSLLIQLDQHQYIHKHIKLNITKIRKQLFITGIFQTNQFIHTQKQKITLFKLIQINKIYHLILKIIVQQHQILFQTNFINNNSLIAIKDKHQKLIFTRFLPKYISKNSLKILISQQGSFRTKYIFKTNHLNNISSFLFKEQSNYSWIRIILKEFIEDSVQFYKSLITKLQANIHQINKVKPQYCQNMLKSFNLINYSYEPTFQMYKSNTKCCKFFNTFNIQAAFQKKIINQNKLLFQQINLYSNDNLSLLFQEKKQLLTSNMTQLAEKPNLQQIYFDLEIFQDNQNQKNSYIECKDKTEPTKIQLYKKIFISNLQMVLGRKDGLNQEIYNEIQIKNKGRIIWQIFDPAFTNLKIAKITYINKNSHQKQLQDIMKNTMKKQLMNRQPQIFNSMVILKHDIFDKSREDSIANKNNQGQIKWEKSIISHCFKGQSCPYLPKYFFTTDNILGNKNQETSKVQYLMSEYVKRGTLRTWINQSGEINSICTKINIILYILYGLTYLHSKDVFHMDLKPSNILMDKGLVPKLTDFGAAYNKELHQKMRKQKQQYFLSFSIPYTAPQIFMKTKRPSINPKCDIFSIGLIAYEILRNEKIFNESDENITEIYRMIGKILQKTDIGQISGMKNKQKQVKNVYKLAGQQFLLKKVYFCAQILQQDKSQIYSGMLNLIFRCLSCYQQRRPNVGFLIIAIKEIYQSFLEYYSW